MSKFSVRVAKSVDNFHATKNLVYFQSLPHIQESECCSFLKFNNGYVKLAKRLDPHLHQCNGASLPNYIYLNNIDRSILNVTLDEIIEVQTVPQPLTASSVFISIFDKRNNQIDNTSDIISRCIKTILSSTVVNTGTQHAFYSPELYYATVTLIIDEHMHDQNCAYIDSTTQIIILNNEKKTLNFNLSSVNFENIGVGGLEREFTELIKSIFITRIIPDKIYKMLNIKHTKGAILYGPPGCGKTRIARQIGALIGCSNIKIINGPELLNKYVGESERNIRECFEAAKNKPGELHLLIFDEFDAIASKRSGSDNNYSDKVVGQLLTMLDGVEEIDNIIVFALTNRLDIIDTAILRPGRFGVHIKIGLPDLHGRYEILKIHSKDLARNKLFSSDLDLMSIAAETDNFTGAELESLIQTTVQNVLGSQVDFNNIVESAKKIEHIMVTMDDFSSALSKIKPMFKNKRRVHTDLSSKIRGAVDLRLVPTIIATIDSKNYPLVTCVHGANKSGKTSIVCDIAIKMSDNVAYVTASDVIEMTDKNKADYLTEIFSRTEPTLIILDNIETIIEFVSEAIFNRNILHTIKLLLNSTVHRVIITTSYYHRLKQMTILDSVQYVVEIPSDQLTI